MSVSARRLRIGVVAGIVALLGVRCGGGKGRGDGGADGPSADGGGNRHAVEFEEAPNRKLDVLFMIDDSASTEAIQASFTRNLRAFVDVLKSLPGGLPDVHLAVVTSDMGAGDGSIPGCIGNGKNGAFQNRAKQGQGLPACTSTTLVGDATYINSSGGPAPERNFTADDILTVLQCIAPVGSMGCGFEQPLAAVARALGADGAPAPAENQGFLRPEALLAIVMLTNEDDCSAPVTSPLFDFAVYTTLSSQIGPPRAYRCNEWGHLCGTPKAPPPRLSPDPSNLDTVVTLDDCVSSEAQGMLTPVQTLAAGIKALKADPDQQILVASIHGPDTPYSVKWRAAPTIDSGPWPEIVPSCVGSDGTADPGIRMRDFTASFGANGIVSSVCDDDFSPALRAIGLKVASAMTAPACYPGAIRNKDASGIDAVPDCVVTERVTNAHGATTDTVIPACADNGNTPPCWALAPGAVTCPSGSHVLQIDRGTVPSAPGTRVRLDCALCSPEDQSPGACL